MSGFVADIGRQVDASRVSGAAAAHADSLPGVVKTVFSADWCLLLAVVRPHERLTIARENGRGLVLALLGAPIRADLSRTGTVEADALIPEIKAGGDLRPDILDGSFQAVLIDCRRRSVTFFVDHLASRPLFQVAQGGHLYLAPSVRCVLQLSGCSPRISREGAVGFLAVGYPLGSHTLIEGVSRFRPAQQITFTPGQVRPQVSRWWDLKFETQRGVAVEDAADCLHEELLKAHRTILSNAAPDLQLALTGGYDSRLMLGVLREVGLLPGAAFTWAATTRVPGSDPDIAARLAAIVRIPHRVVLFKADDVTDNLDAWCVESGLLSDNLGNFAGGGRFLADQGITASTVLVGDQLFGHGPNYTSRSAAISAALGLPWPNLVPALDRLVTSEGREAFRTSLHQQVAELLADCSSDRPKDVSHYLGFHAGVFGWLLAPGFYKEPAVEARRPLMVRRLLEQVTRWPATLRVDKRVEVEVLRRFYSDLYQIPKAQRSALIDWKAALQQPGRLANTVRELLRGIALRESSLASLVEWDRVSHQFARLLTTPNQHRFENGQRLEWAIRFRRSVSGWPGTGIGLRVAEQLARGFLRPPRRHTEVSLFFRLALLERYAELLAGDRQTTPPATAIA